MTTQFGRYQVRRELGRGGMATVYVAYDPHFDREVALKVLPPGLLQDPTFRERFEREAKLIARLEHTAIVPVYDYGEDQHRPYLVMRHMTGGSLKDRLTAGPMPLDEVIDVTRRICAALDKAHANHIIHRDLKPGNILLDEDGASHLADFGIARLVEATQTMNVLGTPQYMAPEQAHGRPLDARTDVYQMGVVLFEMLTGRVPFDADTPAALLHQHAYAPIPSPREFNTDLPPACERVIERALAKDPAERYPTAAALAEAVAGLAMVEPMAPPTRPARVAPSPADALPAPPRAERPRGRIPIWVWAVAGLVLIVALVVGLASNPELLGLGADEATPTVETVEARPTDETVAIMNPASQTPSPTPTATRTARPTPTTIPSPSRTVEPTPTSTPTPSPTASQTPTVTPPPTLTPVPPTATAVLIVAAETRVIYHDGTEQDGVGFYEAGAVPWLDLLVRSGDTWYGPERQPDDGINALPLPAGYAWRAHGGFDTLPNGEAWWTGPANEGRAWLSTAGGITVAELTLRVEFADGSQPGPKATPTPRRG